MTIKNQRNYWLDRAGLQTLCLAVVAIITLAFALSYTRSILIPFVLSLFLYFILTPVREFFIQKLKLPKTLALIMTFISMGLLFSVIAYVLSLAIQEFAGGFGAYQAKAVYFANMTQEWLVSKGLPLGDQVSFSELVKRIPITQIVRDAGSGVFNLIAKSLLVFIFLIFLFTGSLKSRKKVQNKQSSFAKEIHQQIRKYIGIKLLTSGATAVITFIILSLLGLDLAFVFSFLAFCLNFIPTIGSIIAVLLPIPVAFFQYDSFLYIFLVVALPGMVQAVIGNLMEPKMMGESLDLHPVTVLLSLMFWSLIWGVAGAFLAVPVTAAIKIILLRIEGGDYISQIMAGDLLEEDTESE